VRKTPRSPIRKLLKRDGSGGERYLAARVRSSQRSPSPPQCPVKTGQPTGTDASMFELPESGQHLLGTQQYVCWRRAVNVTSLRQLKLCQWQRRTSASACASPAKCSRAWTPRSHCARRPTHIRNARPSIPGSLNGTSAMVTKKQATCSETILIGPAATAS